MSEHRRRSAIAAAAALALALPGAAMADNSSRDHGASGRWLGIPVDAAKYVGRQAAAAPGWTVAATGLDNPRQLVWANHSLIVAEAGHGSYKADNCVGAGHDQFCFGRSGQVSFVRRPAVATAQQPQSLVKGLLSGAGPDGSFALGADGADFAGGALYIAMAAVRPPASMPGIPGQQAGKLLKASSITGEKRIYADIARFEKRHNPDGEEIDSNPYAVLTLARRQLVADAAADAILQVRNGRVSVWAVLPELGKRVDAVPTSITKGPDGRIYVGGLGSEIPGDGAVYQFNRRGRLLGTIAGFSTVTGVAVSERGTIFVSELFGGDADNGFPGAVVRVSPNLQKRHAFSVPFPAGLVVHRGTLYVNAYSVSTAKGSFGPDTSGQVWRRTLG